MTEFILAMVVFIATHAVPAYRPVRLALVSAAGERIYLGGYSLVSLAAIGWLVAAYARAPHVEVWPFAGWTLWVPVLAMPLSCVLLAAGLAAPNPLSLLARSKGFDPRRPGIVAVTRHPVIWALVLWSAAHIPANGDVASLILFGVLLASSLAGSSSLDHKRRGGLGEEAWRELAAATSNLPFAAIVAGRARTSLADIGYRRLAAGLVLYTVFLVAHEYVIGVSPLP